MTNPSVEFFRALTLYGATSIPEEATGSVLFELTQEHQRERWRVDIDRGGVRVLRDDTQADCVVRADLALFDRIVSGEVNAMAALLRGALTVEGDPEPLVLMQRLFPTRQREVGPPRGAGSQSDTATSGARPVTAVGGRS